MTNNLRLYTFLCFSFSIASAQVAPVRQGSFEIGGFFGSSYGLDTYRIMGGGNVSYGVTKYLLPYVEYSYFPGIERKIPRVFPNGNPVIINEALPISDFHGGVHIRIPIRESKLVPYGVFGVGGLTLADRTASATSSDGHTGSFPVGGETDVAINFGGGLRYYIGQRFGVRVEAKVYKPYGASAGYNDVFGKVEFGFFLQLH